MLPSKGKRGAGEAARRLRARNRKATSMNIDSFPSQMSMSSRVAQNARRSGFTLVELLVVIAIIGILIGLLLPAVQAALESGRRAACINNMHQIGISTNSYETSQRQYPVNWGTVSTIGTPTNGTGPSA